MPGSAEHHSAVALGTSCVIRNTPNVAMVGLHRTWLLSMTGSTNVNAIKNVGSAVRGYHRRNSNQDPYFW